MADPITTKPCPFCGGVLAHIESVARSFDPPRIYHEFVHPDVPCHYLPKKRWTFTDDATARSEFVASWNMRSESL